MRLYILVFFVFLLAACNGESANTNSAVENRTNVSNITNKTTAGVPVYTYEIVNTYKHDPRAFTQGLVYHNGFLYESTGQYGSSTLRKVELETGKVLQQHKLSRDYFAEGITILDDKIYQLSWQEYTGFVYNLNDFSLVKEFKYPGEGWGLADDGKHLIMTDGTHVIRFLDPETSQTVRTLVVLDENGKPLMKLNELEYIKGEIWANIWHSEEIGKPNHIARIDPQTGKLLGWIDLNGVSPKDVERSPENTLNGIAYDEANDRIFITGKNWQNLFEIIVKPKG